PYLNDKIRGKGSFMRVLRNLAYFTKNYKVGIMTTLLNSNIDYLTSNLEKFVNFFFSCNVKEIIFERFIPVGEAKMVMNELVPIQKILLFYKKISELFNVDYDILKLYPAVKLEFEHTKSQINVFGAECVVGRYGCAILSDGTVYPCRRYSVELLNLYKTEVDKLLAFYTHNNYNVITQEIFFCYASLIANKTFFPRGVE
ncbi:MAG: hypothetical protein NZ839_02620, partial [Endomicrobia bacterium]|nr:hypothetical protein [Endomicrobiia bacterium]